MRIKFLITGAAWKPLGGLRMIYEYANRLVADGHDVDIYYSAHSIDGIKNLKNTIKTIGKYWYFRLGCDDYRCTRWFNLDCRINEHWLWALTYDAVGGADRYIATTLGSAYMLNEFPNDTTSKWFYFVQDYENWGNGISDEVVDRSYKFPMQKISVASWLDKCIKDRGSKSIVVENGFDLTLFVAHNPIEKRIASHIVMMYNTKLTKGCDDCFAALELVKNEIKDLKVSIFGIPQRPDGLPDWYEYYQQPTKKKLIELYNDAAIYIGASHTEGWGLTVGEAMACGCAVACTDNAGYQEMAHDGVTALVSSVRSPKALAENILKLMNDPELRHSIAMNGNKFIQSLDIEKTYVKFKSALRC